MLSIALIALAAFVGDIDERIGAVERGLVPLTRTRAQAAGSVSIPDRLEQLKVPALSVAVIDRYQLAWARAYGQADVEQNRPATTETLFQAASLSKPITALLVLRLVEQGRVRLDVDVNNYLKSWKVPVNEWTRQKPVTLRALLSHTAGTTVHGFPGYRPSQKLPTLVQILQGQKPANHPPIQVDRVPGRSFRYSGGGTMIAQLVIEDSTGQPFGALAEREVLAPLGMKHSTFSQPLAEGKRSLAATAYSYQGVAYPGGGHVYPELAAAGLWTTSTDLTLYVRTIQDIRRGTRAGWLARDTIDSMLTRQNQGPAGLGPFLVGTGDHLRFEHSGSNAGFVCKFVGYVDAGQGAVVMANSDRAGPLLEEVLRAIARVYQWRGYGQPPEH